MEGINLLGKYLVKFIGIIILYINKKIQNNINFGNLNKSDKIIYYYSVIEHLKKLIIMVNIQKKICKKYIIYEKKSLK